MAYDEAISVHEKLVPVMNQWVDASGLFHFSWIIPALPFVLVVLLMSIRFLHRTDARTRTLMILSGAIFVGGAIGFEALGGLRISKFGFPSTGDLVYFMLVACEEAMEMLGVALFIYTLIRNFERNFGVFAVRLGRVSLRQRQSDAV